MDAERQVGRPVDWHPARRPEPTELKGRHVRLRPVHAGADAEPLHAESHPPAGDPHLWTYLPTGPYRDAAGLREALSAAESSRDPLFFALVRLPDEAPAGIASYLRITPEHGSIEIGHIWFGASLRRSTAAAEAIYLLAVHAFDVLGYRRLEWKCDALNQPSRRAAERFGFRYEGTFVRHMVVKGRNRDTAWYAITDAEWPAVRDGFDAWLAPANFDEAGRQRRRLGELIAEARRASPPAVEPVSAEANKDLIRRLVEEGVARRDPGVIDEIATGEFAQAAKRWVSPFRGAFPDFEMEIVELIAEGDRIVAHFKCSGTHRGEWLGVAATGRRFESVDEVYVFRVRGGKLVSAMGVEDNLTRLRQLGIPVGAGTPARQT